MRQLCVCPWRTPAFVFRDFCLYILRGESRRRFLVPRSGARTLIFTGQAFCHFLLLSLFPSLFLLALLECLWTSTWHALLFPSENEKAAIRSCVENGTWRPTVDFDVGVITSAILVVRDFRPSQSAAHRTHPPLLWDALHLRSGFDRGDRRHSIEQ